MLSDRVPVLAPPQVNCSSSNIKNNSHNNNNNHPSSSRNASRDYLHEESILARLKHVPTDGCGSYLRAVGAVALSNAGSPTQEEADFPVAFAVSLHHQVGILEQFMASTFRPADSVCVHVDAKASETVWQAAKAVMACYR